MTGQDVCETCGNRYDAAVQVLIEGETHGFDCFECDVERLAPRWVGLRLPRHRAWSGSGWRRLLFRPA